MASGGFGSRKQEEVEGSEIVTAPSKDLIDAATVVQALPAMNAAQLVKQMYAGPNSLLPQRLGVSGALQEDARYATSNLLTGVAKQGGIPALGQPQMNAQRQFSHALTNRVMQVQKDAEDSDRMWYNQLVLNKRRRDEGLRVMLNEMLSNGVETERLLHQEADAWKKALIQQHEKLVTEMQAAAIERETVHNIIITQMQDAAKEAERLLVEKHDRVVTELQDAAKETETLVEKHKKKITEMQVAAKEAETLLVDKHDKLVTKMQADVRKEVETHLVQKHKKLVNKMEKERKEAEATLVKDNKRLLSDQADAHKKAEEVLIKKQEKLRTEVEDARKENEEHKREINGQKEKVKELLQKQSNLKADVEKEHADEKHALNAQLESLESQLAGLNEEKTTLEKELVEAKHAMNVQVESLTSQLAALKEENTTLEEEHEGCKQRLSEMNSKLEFMESQLPGRKQGVTTVGKNDSKLLALQLQLAELQEDKVKLQKALDALKSKINSKVDKGSIKLLWEVAEKVLTLPEDVRVCQSVHYASGYDTLLSTREENNVDKMMSYLHAALNEAAKNWKIAQADVEKIKWSCQRNLMDAVMGRSEPASETTTPPKDTPNSETTAPPRDISNHVMEYISDDPENESMEEHPQKKRKRLTTLTELKKRQSSCSSSSQQTKLPPKQRNPRRSVPGH